MRKIAGMFCFLAGMSVSSIAQELPKATIVLVNPSGISRVDEVMEVRWKDIKVKYPAIDTANFKVINKENGQEVVFQLDRTDGGIIKNLLVQLSLKAGGQLKLLIIEGKPAAVQRKAYARFVSERYDDFAWENDKVAHRMYGKALESRKDNAFGTDIWVKRTNRLVIDDWYKSGDYHTDHGEGMDYYSVGFTLGAGDIAPYLKDSVVFSKNYHHWKILDNGPLRVTFELGYDAWNVGGREVKVTKRISLDAGSRMNRIEARYTYDGTEVLPVVIGVVKRKEPGKIKMDQRLKLLGYWEPEHGADGTTGVGVIAAGQVEKINEDGTHYLIHTIAKNKEPLVYYSGSAWSKSKEISTAEQWFEYLSVFESKLKHPIKISVK